jgi:RimJ/RimL family protein N-acetyltransferase
MEKTVYFRSFEEEDAELIYKWMNDDDLKKLSVGVNRRMCRDEALEWVKARMRDDRNNVWWAICAKDTNKLIGYMSLNSIHYINRSADFGGLVIGDKEYQDGSAWIESYLFLYEYAFERLGMNRVYGVHLVDHSTTSFIGSVFFSQKEGIMRQAFYKNGRFYDASIGALLSEDYFAHKQCGDYELEAVMKRMMKKIRETKRKQL